MVRLPSLWKLLLAIVLACVWSAPAAGQYGPPPRTEVPQTPGAQANAAQPAAASTTEVLRAAACVARRDAEAAAALLGAAPFSADERDKAVALLQSAQRCLRLRAPIATSALLFRGAVAETLYESRFAQPPAARNPAVAAAPFLRAAELAGRSNAAALTAHFEVAQCTVPAQHGQVRALLATEPGSEAETAALTALYPAFGSCVPAGTQLGIDRRGMRAILAETLYRWSVVQQDGPASAWAAAAAPAR